MWFLILIFVLIIATEAAKQCGEEYNKHCIVTVVKEFHDLVTVVKSSMISLQWLRVP